MRSPFSPDGARLYERTESELLVRDAATLEEVTRFAWSAAVSFLGVSPSGALIGASDDGTSWRDPETFAVQRTLGARLTSISFSADGALGVATSASATLHFVTADGVELTRAAPPSAAFPQIVDPAADRFGAAGRPVSGSKLAVAESTAGGVYFELERFAWATTPTKYDRELFDVATRDSIRRFSSSTLAGSTRDGRSLSELPAAALSADGSKLYTLEIGPAEPYVATWCR